MSRRVRDRMLWSMFDGEIRQEYRSHLDACLTCAARYRRLERRMKVLTSVLAETPPLQAVGRGPRAFHTPWISAASGGGAYGRVDRLAAAETIAAGGWSAKEVTPMKPANWVWLGVMALSLWRTTGLAQPRFGTGPMGPGGLLGDDRGPPLPMILSGINLTPDQQARLRKLMEANRAILRTLFSQLEAAHQEMAAQLLAPGEVDAADLTAHIRHVTQVREQLMQAGLKVALEVRSVLTPDQLAKASQLQEGIEAIHTEMSHLFEERP